MLSPSRSASGHAKPPSSGKGPSWRVLGVRYRVATVGCSREKTCGTRSAFEERSSPVFTPDKGWCSRARVRPEPRRCDGCIHPVPVLAQGACARASGHLVLASRARVGAGATRAAAACPLSHHHPRRPKRHRLDRRRPSRRPICSSFAARPDAVRPHPPATVGRVASGEPPEPSVLLPPEPPPPEPPPSPTPQPPPPEPP